MSCRCRQIDCASVMDPTVHGYSLTARKPAAGVGATWGFAGTTPSRVASMRAYASGASDLSAVSNAPTKRQPATATMKEISENETYTLPRWCMLGQLRGYYPWLSPVAVYRLIEKSLPKVWYGELS